MPSPWLAGGDGVLAQELERVVDRFAAARAQTDALETGP